MLVNLGASSLIISITAISVDYILEKNYRTGIKKGTELACRKIKNCADSMLMNLGLMFGFRISRLDPEMNNTLNWIAETHTQLDTYIKNIDFKNTSIEKHFLLNYKDNLKNNLVDLNEIADLYVFALTPERLGSIHEPREQISNTIQILEIADSVNNYKRKEDLVRSAMPYILEAVLAVKE